MPKIPFLAILKDSLHGSRRAGTKDREAQTPDEEEPPQHRLLIVGNPNVGKSVLFNRLTGRYVVVSNYPGTTVEVSRGKMRVGAALFEVVDTPGMYSLRPLSEEERVGRALLLQEAGDLVIHVVDAKNLDRMLPLTLQLIEAGFPVLLTVNMMDESERLGLRIDLDGLSRRLEIPVVGTVALTGRGMEELRNRIHEYVAARTARAIAV